MATQERIGTKRLVVGAHYGTFDFIVQRCTAIIMAVYTLVLFFGVLFTSGMSFESWQNLFTFQLGAIPAGQLLATLAFLSLAWHAWIGVRDIWMDYVTSAGLRLFLQVLTVLWLIGSVVYFAKVLWSL
ncbi:MULTISPECIES: succinate dehydrogenase, hydrophobic membrane anchor protein [Alcaligenaceae]|jgi:succinate dehydrogenase / fumarate reductase membrane anchor subunit|uniref:Succinate dehydrogenase hydrophobic membrane anchor subunit n=1 Tax=Neopusillimonas maritima TaxID=2026239 RepID=A0A3A1YW19_9BURK|nr:MULTISPECIES: succinate dehydrogenase, hydrophobic membrane anchor protein [Alcaligenaceae]QIM50022.1 succinate dehydrogenase, hydrophobic membrane anchor protein [Pusillimonas sp. DMV24BSW_D]RII82718.1 succinate dehydrogenase, hydrophobic membrane anchor protein [Neopusillimonas maritima]RIY40267.1 succinate dehydrogenase, hydrophobic membrane anchor protein [Neopusillimonas maritima]|tara:strand:- start:58 stop:441 length:384 start_codon:yes stop_codon:yes gene_type:complete